MIPFETTQEPPDERGYRCTPSSELRGMAKGKVPLRCMYTSYSRPPCHCHVLDVRVVLDRGTFFPRSC